MYEKGNLNSNIGSNRNAGRKHESEAVPDRAMKYTQDQTERNHATMPVAEEGSIPNRDVVKSGVAERHIQSDDGFKIRDRRSASVAQNRKVTENTFDDRRKKTSSV